MVVVFRQIDIHQKGVGSTFKCIQRVVKAMVELRTAVPEEIDRYLDSLVSNGPFSSKAELVRAALASYTSMAGPMAQVFDKDTIYSPDGRVYQMEYARESALRGPPIVGIVYDRGVLLACKIVCPSPLLKYTKVVRISRNIAVCPTGLAVDSHVAIRNIRESNPASIEELVDAVTLQYWENSSNKGKRPLGTILLIASIFRGKPALIQFEPSGAFIEGKAIAAGRGFSQIQASLNMIYKCGNAKNAEEMARSVLGKLDELEMFEMTHLRR